MRLTRKIQSLLIAALLLASCTSYPKEEWVEPVLGPSRAAPAEMSLPGTYGPAAPGMAVPDKVIKIGLLVPMTGPNAALGRAMQDAAVQAVFDKYDTLPRRELTVAVEIVPKDTGDSPAQAAKATRDAMAEGVQMILGPVFSNQVPAVAPIALEKNIPVVSFSNNLNVMTEGVYLFGFMPEEQVRRIADFAIRRGYQQIAGLAPSTPYGNMVMKQLSEQANLRGVRAHPIEYYPDTAPDVERNINRLAMVLVPDPAGRALFIAEGGEKLARINKAMIDAKLSGQVIPLLGTGLWDSAETLRYPALMGGLFASADPNKYGRFEDRFKGKFGYLPDRRASLAYDATALAATLALAPTGPNFGFDAMTDPIGFNGPANGVFRFTKARVAEHGLAVLQVTPNGFNIIESAPESFLR